jgi:hypothetical protein
LSQHRYHNLCHAAASVALLSARPVLAQHKEEAGKARSAIARNTSSSSSSGERPWRGPPANFPSLCLLGSPFTSLAVTHNFLSHLHAEPREHPFSYIAWLDVVGPGSRMQVGWQHHTTAVLQL